MKRHPSTELAVRKYLFFYLKNSVKNVRFTLKTQNAKTRKIVNIVEMAVNISKSSKFQPKPF